MTATPVHLVAIVPTRNEAGSLPWLLPRLIEAGAAVVVVDDDSPDGTAATARALLDARDAAGEVVVRRGARGRGSAVLEGMRLALERYPDAEYLLELDADGSHDPREVVELLAAARSSGAALVIGARSPRESETGELWPLHRRLFHRANGALIGLLLRLPTSDPTNGMRLWRPDAARLLLGTPLRESGFIGVAESTDAIRRAGGRIVEVETSFYPRIAGDSKAGPAELFRALRGLMRIARSPVPVGMLDGDEPGVPPTRT